VKYPEDCIQSLVGDWWVTGEPFPLTRGQLLYAFLPHVDQQPHVLEPIGRTEATDHTKANYRIKPLAVRDARRAPELSVAALPKFEGEVYGVYRTKRRPAVILSVGGDEIPRELRTGGAKWQTAPTLTVAPLYGVAHSGKRGGWNPDLVKRIRRAEYSQCAWDLLPIGREAEGSILRFDHAQPIGRHHDSYELTPHRLSEEAMRIVDEWYRWYVTGLMDPAGILFGIRAELMKLGD
jgi:hypothetical protein